MNKQLANTRTTKLCALCKHWYNPSGEGLVLKPGNFVEIDRDLKCPCLKKNNMLMKAIQCCYNFEKKF